MIKASLVCGAFFVSDNMEVLFNQRDTSAKSSAHFFKSTAHNFESCNSCLEP